MLTIYATQTLHSFSSSHYVALAEVDYKGEEMVDMHTDIQPEEEENNTSCDDGDDDDSYDKSDMDMEERE